jgi:ribonuclease P protein component
MRAERKEGRVSPFERKPHASHTDSPRLATASERKIPRGAHVLRKSSDFETVLRSGCRIASASFVLRAAPNRITHARLGIIASRKIAARAVDRNRAKRLVREAFRAFAARLGNYDVTIQLRANLRSQMNDAVRAELNKLLDSFVRRSAVAIEKRPEVHE